MKRWLSSRSEGSKIAPATNGRNIAKLTRPRTDAVVPRERLFARLDDARRSPVVWISAPAGAGKTSLVSSYLDRRATPALWYQLDRPDGDPGAFFHFLRQAASAVPGASCERLPSYSIEHASDPVGFALHFFRRLHATLSGETIVVLDDFHHLPARSPLQRALAAAGEEWPDDGTLLCISRADPPDRFARLLAGGRLARVDWQELKLHLDEVRAIVAAQGDLSSDIVELLYEQSGGWAAGVVLLLERLRQVGSFESLAGARSLDFIFDYFADQVYRGCTERTRDALLRMSYLTRITVESARCMTKRADIDDLLSTLSRRNLFIGQHPADAMTFEFHALFRAFLQHRARRIFGEADHASLAREAAELLLDSGHVEYAMQALLETRAWDRAAAVIRDHANRLVCVGRRALLLEWIEALPECCLDDPWLRYWLGVACSGRDARRSARALREAGVRFERSGDRRGQVLTLSAQIGSWWSERCDFSWIEPLLDRLAALLEHEDELDRETQAAALCTLIRPWLMLRPMRDEVHGFAQRLQRLPLRELAPALAVRVGVCRMEYFWMRGDSDALSETARALEATIEHPEAAIGDRLWFHFWLMTHHVYCADAVRAMEAMERARSVTEEANLAPGHVDFARWATTVDMQLGRADRARRRLDDELAPQLASMAPTAAVFVHLELTRCAVEEERFDDAIVCGRLAAEVASRCGYVWAQVPARLAWCGALCLGGQLDEARRQVELVRGLLSDQLPMQFASVAFYEALVCSLEGRIDAARDAVHRCFALRANTSYVWGPGWTRPAAARVAAFALEQGICNPEVTRMIRGLRLRPPEPVPAGWPWAVRIRALGSFSVTVDDAGLERPAAKAAHRLMELLKAVVAAGGLDVPGEQLIDAVWADAQGDVGWNSLHTGLHRLRRMLRNDEAISLRDNKVSLNASVCYLDIWDFAARLCVFEGARPADDASVAVLRDTLALYRDHLLADEGEQPWLIAPRETMRQRWLEAVRKAGDWYESCQAWSEAADVFRAALLIDPGDESLCRRLMLSLANAGESGEALAAFGRWEQLSRARGAIPGEAIRRLRNRLIDSPHDRYSERSDPPVSRPYSAAGR